MNKQALLFYPLLGVVLLVLFVGGLAYGAVPIPLDHVMDILLGKGSDKIAWQNIVLQSRLPQAITALLGGGFTGYEWAVVANLIPESVGRTLYIRYQ